MFDLWAPEHSVLREKALEHAFLTELSKVLLLEMAIPLEVLRPEFDANGYDVVLEARGIMRHVQFKAMKLGGKRRHVDVALALSNKPSGCVVWFVADPASLDIGPFYWLGGSPGTPLPDLGNKVTRHSKGNAKGEKNERLGHREVPIRNFTKLDTIRDVALAMFGTEISIGIESREKLHKELLREHLNQRRININELPDPLALNFADSATIAHMIDGYELGLEAGLLASDDLEGAAAFVEAGKAQFERIGQAVGTPLELWVTLFLQHRLEKFSGPIGLPDTSNIGISKCNLFEDAVCHSLSRLLSNNSGPS